MEPQFGSIRIAQGGLQILAEVLVETTEAFLWRKFLHENVNEIRSGNKINEAEQQLKQIEEYINDASIIVAGAIDKPKEACDWIDKAQKAAFSLEDQIAMYRIQGFNLGLLDFIYMKSAIGKSSIKRLTSTLKDCIEERPDAMKDSGSMEQLCEVYPFIRYSNPVAACGKARIMGSVTNKLKDLVMDSNSASVIFIIGGKGSGRTTLMKSLYEDSSVKSFFGPRSWVDDAANITDLYGLLRKVLEVEGSAEGQEAISQLEIMSKIQGTFHGEGKGRYLIVLDDVEDTGALRTLKHVLKGCKGKIVCLTTRRNINEHVQEDIEEDSKTLTISPLEESDAHELLMRASFPGFDGDRFEKAIEWKANKKIDDEAKKVTILNQVLEKCMGNPWNIRTVGKLFAAYPLERWEEIQERIDGLLIDGNRGIEKLDPPIQLEDLKLPLADWRSFLYCLAFPEGSEISAQKLVRLWIAEGFVQDSPLHSQEHEAESLLQGLIKKNLLVETKKSLDGKVLKCSVNKHIRPLALEMCELQKFCRFVPDNSLPAASPSNSSASRYRVFSILGDRGVKEVSDSETLRKDIRLRSLLYFGTGRMQHEEFKLSFTGPHRRRTFRLLQTLELQGARLRRLPRSIGYLVCLRYLGLRNTELEDLSASFDSLKKLLCLDIRDNYITSLNVSAFTEMRHLHLAKSFRSQSVLIKEGLRSLVYLRTLSGAADGGNLEQELSSLGFLRKLSIKVSSASSKNICAAVSNMGSLHSLAITAYSEDLEKEKKNTSEGMEPVEKKENISDGEPLENKEVTPERTRFDIGSLKIGEKIRKLKLGGDMGKLSADRISMMHSLTHLYLWDSKLDVDVLLRLQGLQDLLLLSICNASTYSKLSCTQGGYCKLKKLSIVSMENLIECTFGTGAMKNLEELKFTKCDNLTGVSAKGLEHILSLKRVYLSEMHPDFVKSVKGSATGVQIHKIDMHFNKSSRAATGGSQTRTHKPGAPPAIGGEATETKAIIDTITPPRGPKYSTQDTKSGHKLLADAQKSYEHIKPAPPQSPSSEKGKEPLIGKDTDDDSDEDNDSQTKPDAGYEAGPSSIFVTETQIMEQSTEIDLTVEKRKNPLAQEVVTSTTSNEERTPEGNQTTAPESVTPLATEGEGTTQSMVIDPTTPLRGAKGTTQNTKSCASNDGDKAGQTSSMAETHHNSEQAKQQPTKDQSSDVGPLIPHLQESELHVDDSAVKNACTASPIQSSDSTPSTNQESSSKSRDDMDIQRRC